MTEKTHHVVMLEVAEIACIIVEELIGKRRPEGCSPEEALQTFSPDEADDLRHAADRIIHYFYAQLQAGGTEAQLQRHDAPEKLS